MATSNIVKHFLKVLVVVYQIASVFHDESEIVWSLSVQDVILWVRNILHGSESFLINEKKEVLFYIKHMVDVNQIVSIL